MNGTGKTICLSIDTKIKFSHKWNTAQFFCLNENRYGSFFALFLLLFLSFFSRPYFLSVFVPVFFPCFLSPFFVPVFCLHCLSPFIVPVFCPRFLSLLHWQCFKIITITLQNVNLSKTPPSRLACFNTINLSFVHTVFQLSKSSLTRIFRELVVRQFLSSWLNSEKFSYIKLAAKRQDTTFGPQDIVALSPCR